MLQTKSELLDALPKDGAAFLNGDNEGCRSMFSDCSLKGKYLFGLEGDDLYMKASDIRVDSTGSAFTLTAADGATARCHTVLLGRHNRGNIAGAAALAKYRGLTMEQIAAGIEKLQPIEHRLQLIQGHVTVVDDAFNANPAGTKAALEVLKSFAPVRRIIVTPGMIELGAEEEALNEAFGRDIAGAADIAILVGKAAWNPLNVDCCSGLCTVCIVQVNTLNDATAKLPLFCSGSVVLFENDLPDNTTRLCKLGQGGRYGKNQIGRAVWQPFRGARCFHRVRPSIAGECEQTGLRCLPRICVEDGGMVCWRAAARRGVLSYV